MELPRKKRLKISPYDEDIIIDVWGAFAADIRSKKRNGSVYAKMSRELRDQGLVLSIEELRTKIHNLTSRYYREKKKLVGSEPSDWPPYRKVQLVIKSSQNVNRVQEPGEETCLSFSDATVSSIPPSPSITQLKSEPPAKSPSGPPSEPPLSRPPSAPPTREILGPPFYCRKKNDKHQTEIIRIMKEAERRNERDMEQLKDTERQMLKLEQRKTEAIEKFSNSFDELKTTFINYLQRRK